MRQVMGSCRLGRPDRQSSPAGEGIFQDRDAENVRGKEEREREKVCVVFVYVVVLEGKVKPRERGVAGLRTHQRRSEGQPRGSQECVWGVWTPEWGEGPTAI